MVLESADKDQNQIDQNPDSQAAKGNELKQSRSNFFHVEPVNPQVSQEEAKQQGNKTGFGGYGVSVHQARRI